MQKKSSEEIIRDLENISPLALPKYIAKCEFYDSTSSRQILDDTIAEFEKDGGAENSILKPIMLSVADGLIEALPNTRQLRRKGLTPQRIYDECEAFSYEAPLEEPLLNSAYWDYKNAREYNRQFANEQRTPYTPETRKLHYQNINAMDKYKKAALKNNDGRKNLTDEYTGESNIYAFQKNPDMRRNDPKFRYQAQTDHIVPLKQIHTQLAGNYALSDNDIRMIANKDYNFALTSAQINQTKQDQTNSEYVKQNQDSLDEATKQRMLQLEKEALIRIDVETNKTVGKNLLWKGTVSSAEKSAAYAAFEQKNGRKPTKEEKQKIQTDLQRSKTNAVYGQALSNATAQAVDCAVGNVIMFALKPLYYELKDTFRNGFEAGVNAESGLEAIQIRFSRVKDYIIKNVSSFLGDNLWDFIKGFVSSLIEGIISLFVGIFKQILKIIKEGFRLFVQSAKILWGKESANRSPAEKGDAIIKLVGGSVMALAGIGVESLLNQIGIGDPWSTVLATMISGISAALFMYLLDKVDLFCVKAERREARIKEIFELRKQELIEDCRQFDSSARATLKKQRIAYEQLKASIDDALSQKNFSQVSRTLDNFAVFFQITLPYRDSASFVQYIKDHPVIKINDENTVLG